MTTSARGLSSARISRSATSTIGAVARTAIVFDVLFGKIAGATCAWMRIIVLIACETSCVSACDR